MIVMEGLRAGSITLCHLKKAQKPTGGVRGTSGYSDGEKKKDAHLLYRDTAVGGDIFISVFCVCHALQLKR